MATRAPSLVPVFEPTHPIRYLLGEAWFEAAPGVHAHIDGSLEQREQGHSARPALRLQKLQRLVPPGSDTEQN
ncbi:hypothetical protein DPMN_079366 [Dreissena polymorpha]|uniref:Uncharacterized protein n=1 Tax=Dreissena polymorpha TaxID=45954 RepID=A0A9D4BIB2_DREPO|nr:hypothetical protein DPMN_079366 [Dreissena polymorpha]